MNGLGIITCVQYYVGESIKGQLLAILGYQNPRDKKSSSNMPHKVNDLEFYAKTTTDTQGLIISL